MEHFDWSYVGEMSYLHPVLLLEVAQCLVTIVKTLNTVNICSANYPGLFTLMINH